MRHTITLSDTGGGSNIDPLPPSAYEAICYGVLDIGTHIIRVPGKPETKQRRVILMFAVPGETVHYQGRDDATRVVSQEYNMSLNSGSNLYKSLVSWRGKPFTAAELQKFVLSNVIGVPALIYVNLWKSGKGNGIGNIMPYTRREKLAIPSDLTPVSFSVEAWDGNEAELEELPKFIANKIRNSEEARRKRSPASQDPGAYNPAPVEENFEEDDVPF